MVMRSCRYEGYKDSTSLWPAVQACWVSGGNCSISNSERRSALQRGCKCNLQFMRRHSSSKSVHTSTACMSYMFLLNTSCKSNDLLSFSKDMHAAKLCINKNHPFLNWRCRLMQLTCIVAAKRWFLLLLCASIKRSAPRVFFSLGYNIDSQCCVVSILERQKVF